MNASKPTDGKWSISSAYPARVVTDTNRKNSSRWVADCDSIDPELTQEDEANARVMAASKDLLAAAKRALAVFKAQGESVRPGTVLGALDDAITKATGAKQ